MIEILQTEIKHSSTDNERTNSTNVSAQCQNYLTALLLRQQNGL